MIIANDELLLIFEVGVHSMADIFCTHIHMHIYICSLPDSL